MKQPYDGDSVAILEYLHRHNGERPIEVDTSHHQYKPSPIVERYLMLHTFEEGTR